MFKFVNAPPRKVPRSCERSCAVSGAELDGPRRRAGREGWGVWCVWYYFGLCLTQCSSITIIMHAQQHHTHTRGQDGILELLHTDARWIRRIHPAHRRTHWATPGFKDPSPYEECLRFVSKNRSPGPDACQTITSSLASIGSDVRLLP